jgi:hypothetical protein
LIDLQPFGIVPHGLSIDRVIDMIKKAELAKGGFEEGTPSEEGDVDIVRVMGTWLRMLTCCRAEMATAGGVDLSAKGFREEVTEEKGLDAMEAEEQREW